ncbi:MAG: immunoglobulin domain-containing protein [Verrucomicrobia bacterium]|nr:immunoglobulin domain-containing protein [Verrucomicrobiota bacterium]
MKRLNEKNLPLVRNLLLSAAALALCSTLAHGIPIITNVVETGGDNEATDTITPKWTGVTFVNGVAGEYQSPFTVPLFGEDAPCFVDRTHQWNGVTNNIGPNIGQVQPILSYLVGAEYIMIGNDNRDNSTNVGYRLDISIASAAHVYILVENRMGDNNGANPPTFSATNMFWLAVNGWLPVTNGYNRLYSATVPDEVAFDESPVEVGPGRSIQQFASVYHKIVPAGTFSTFQADNAGRNMYGVVIVPAVPPPTPTNLTASAYDGQVRLTWAASAGATEYWVKRSLSAGGPYETIATNLSLAFTDTAVVNDTTYYYVVSAANAAGESPNSTEVSAKPQTAPSNVTAVGGTNQVLVSWTGLPNAASYTVSRSATAGGPYTQVGSGITTTEFLNTDAPSGLRLYYVVQAELTGGGQSGVSFEALAITAPSAPSLNVSVYATTVLRVGWTSTNLVVSQFLLEQSLDGTTFTSLATVPASEGGYTNSGLALGTTYFYRAQAQNTTGFSDYSVVASNTTPAVGWNINFANATNGQPANNPAPTPPGYVQDIGDVFGDRGNGFTYGWTNLAGTSITPDGRWRQRAFSPDLRYDTFTHLMKADVANPSLSAVWNIAVPNGFYLVHIVAGDADNVNSVYQFNIEGVVTPALTPTSTAIWQEFTTTCIVGDENLTLNSGPLANNNKIAFVDIYPAVAVPLAIGTQPEGVTVEENRPASFSVAVTNGSTPMFFQWYCNDLPVDGATGSTLSFALPKLNQAGNYYVVITNYAGAVTSSIVPLVVNPDQEAPQIVSVGSLNGTEVNVVFDEVVDPLNAADPSNYSFNGDTVGVVGIPVLRPDGKTVVLRPDVRLTGEFTMDARNIQDIASGTPNLGDSWAASTVLMPPALNQDVGTNLGDPLLADPKYPGSVFVPSSTNLIEVLAGGSDLWNTNDGGHLLYQARTGNFDVKTRVESLLRTDMWSKAGLMARVALAANSQDLLVLVTPPATDNGGANVFQTVTRAATNTASTTLATATVLPYPVWLRLQRVGNTFASYYGSNGVDWVGLNTNTPSPAYPATVNVGLAVTAHNNSSSNTFTRAVFSGFEFLAAPVITEDPFGLAVALGGTATFSVTASGVAEAGALSYQWRFNGVPLAGQTGATLEITNAGPANFGNYDVLVSNLGGTVPSAIAALALSAVAPTITAPPTNATTIVGGTAVFGVTANGTEPLSYQWRFQGGNLANETNLSLTLSNVTIANAGNYDVVVSNVGGSVTSAPPAVLRVLVPPGAGQYNVSGGNFNFTLQSVNGLDYTLDAKDTIDALTWTPVDTQPGNGSVLTLSDPGPLPPVRFYRISVR